MARTSASTLERPCDTANSTSLRRRDGRPLNRLSQGIFVFLGLGVLWVLARAFFATPAMFVQQTLNGLQLGFIYTLIALGYTMIYGIVKLINFAHGDVFMIGAFTSFYAIGTLDLHRWLIRLFPGVPETLATIVGAVTVILLSMIVCGVLAVVMERFAYRPLRNKPRPFEVEVYSAGKIAPGLLVGVWALFIVSLLAYGVLVIKSRRGDLRARAWLRHPLILFGLQFGGFLSAVLTLTGLRIETGGEVWDLAASNVMLIIMGASIVLQVVLQYVVAKPALVRQ